MLINMSVSDAAIETAPMARPDESVTESGARASGRAATARPPAIGRELTCRSIG